MIAQTNLQLLRQLHAAGWKPEQMATVRQAYRLAMELFAGRFHGNGRPFICHLVGSASIVAGLGLSAEEVAASLLHATYEQGVFPSGRRGGREANRAHVRSRVGVAVEALVHAYQKQPWNEAAIAALAAEKSLSPTMLSVAQLRIADLLDDLEDAGWVATPGKFDAAARRRIAKATALAKSIGRPDLSYRLKEAEKANEDAAWAVEAVKGQAQSFSIRPTLFAVLRAHVRRRYTY